MVTRETNTVNWDEALDILQLHDEMIRLVCFCGLALSYGIFFSLGFFSGYNSYVCECLSSMN